MTRSTYTRGYSGNTNKAEQEVRMGKTGLAERKKNRNIEIVMHNALHFFEANGYDTNYP